MTAALAGVLALLAALVAASPSRRRRGSVRPARRLERWLDRGRAESGYQEALPEVLESVARRLRGGSSMRSAIVECRDSCPAAARTGMAPLFDAAAAGVPLDTVADRWARARPDLATGLAAAAIGLAATMGGAPARSLDAVAATLRDRLASAAEGRALSTQARMSAAVVAGAPVAFGLVAGALDPRTVRFLLQPPAGLACLAGGLVFDAVGLWWMRAIVRGAAS